LASNSASATSHELSPDASADAEQLRIAGLTGVDVGLQIAGPGSRSYAFLIDWQIRLLLALGWLGLVVVLRDLASPQLLAHVPLGYVGGLPALALYLLYHPVLEVAMRGRTPGMRRAGLRLVTRSGGTPGIGALLIRNVFRLIDCLPSFYVVGLLCCFITRERVRIGDLAAGTLLIVDARQHLPAAALQAVAQGALTPQMAELIEELLERWPSLVPEQQAALARGLLARVGDQDDSAPPEAHSENAQLRERLRRVLRRRPVGS
jgi:uncharacterized RDD family membrane protein YckC